jgi:hypothetical protein
MYCKGCKEEPILLFDDGSYVGEVSLMCGIKNQFNYILKQCEHNTNSSKLKLYRINKKNFEEIMTNYPDFEKVLLTRALRR